MAHKLTSQERQNRREHYAYRTNNFCVKNEEIKIIVGGWHDSHPVILDKIASGIYTSFLAVSKMIEESDAKVKTFHSKIYDDGESKKYRIHIFTRERTETKRKAMWINAGIYIKLKDKLGYTRIFRMPCRRPFKQLPTDEKFSDDLLLTLTLAFEYSLPRCVLEEFNTTEQCRIIDLWTDVVTNYAGYRKICERKAKRKEHATKSTENDQDTGSKNEVIDLTNGEEDQISEESCDDDFLPDL